MRKPRVQLSGQDGNVFNVIGRVARALRETGQTKAAAEFVAWCSTAGSYDAVLARAMELCDVR